MSIRATNQITILDITDGYTVFLTSEAHTFIGGTSGLLSSQTVITQAIVMQGTEQVPCTIGSITGAEGISATSDAELTPKITPTITISAETSLDSSGVLEIPIIINNDIVFHKKFSYAIAFKGFPGENGEVGADGVSIESITRYYQISGASPVSNPLSDSFGWDTQEPSYEFDETEQEAQYIYSEVYVAEGEEAPSFEADTFYSYDEGTGEYTLLEEDPSSGNWSDVCTDYFTRTLASDSLYYCDVYAWSNGEVTCSQISTATDFQLAKSAMEEASNVKASVTNITNNTVLSLTEEIAALKRREDYTGFITVNPDAPSVAIGKQTETSKWSTEISSEGIALKNGGILVGEFAQSQDYESVMKVNNAVLSTIILRSADGGNGLLGIVAQSNGHVSMKEI